MNVDQAYERLFDTAISMCKGETTVQEAEAIFGDEALARAMTIQATADLRDGIVGFTRRTHDPNVTKRVRRLFARLSDTLHNVGKGMEGVLAWEGVDATADLLEKQHATPAQSDNANTVQLRFDGLYKDDDCRLLRFYADGTVISASTNGWSEDIFRWFKKEARNVSSGQFECEQSTLRFATTSSYGTIEYAGEVGANQLELQWHSQINDNRGSSRLEFIPLSTDNTSHADTLSNRYEPPQVLLEPTRPDIDQLTVFISHHSAERNWAVEVYKQLEEFGFRPIIVPPLGASSGDRMMTEFEVSDLLERRVRESDYLVVLLSPTSALRDWVRHELKIAAYTKGRALYLYRGEQSSIPDFELPEWDSSTDGNPLLIKHTTLAYDGSPENIKTVATWLINDPDEGFLFGDNRPLLSNERDLKQEAQLKQSLRDYIRHMPAFSDRQIVNVYPLIWSRMGLEEGEWDEAHIWCQNNYGSRDLARVGDDYAVSIDAVTVDTDERIQAVYSEGPFLYSLVVWREWQ